MQSRTQMQSRTRGLLEHIRQMPLYRQLVPQEASHGWPIPRRRAGRAFMFVPYVTIEPDPAGGGRIYPPLAAITVEWGSGRVVKYVDLRTSHPAPPDDWESQVGTFPHEAVAGLSREEYARSVGELLAMYDEMLDTLAVSGALPPFWMSRFGRMLRQLLEPSLEPFYRSLAPGFVKRFLGPPEAPRGPRRGRTREDDQHG